MVGCADHLRFALVSEKGQSVARFTAASATDRHSWLTDLAKLKITREMSRKHRAGTTHTTHTTHARVCARFCRLA
jgi:hypothetical protein